MENSPTSPNPRGRPTTARRPSACRWLPSFTAHLQQGCLRTSSAFPVPTTRGGVLRGPRKDQGGRQLHPMAMGTKDLWEAATMGYQNIGPNYWKGEEGRLALLKGEQKLTDEPWVEPFRVLAKWEGLPRRRLRGADLSGQPEPLHAGRAAIYRPAPGKSPASTHRPNSRWAPFPPPVKKAGDTCYISDTTTSASDSMPRARMRMRQDLPHLGRLAGVRGYRCERLPGFFQPEFDGGEDVRSARSGIRLLAEKCKPTIRSTIRSCRAEPLTSRTKPGSCRPMSSRHGHAGAAAKKLQTASTAGFKPVK